MPQVIQKIGSSIRFFEPLTRGYRDATDGRFLATPPQITQQVFRTRPEKQQNNRVFGDVMSRISMKDRVPHERQVDNQVKQSTYSHTDQECAGSTTPFFSK